MIIYGSHLATEIVYKMSKLEERYVITESANVDEGFDELTQRIDKFESVIIPKIENVQVIKNIMLSGGALGALMSGSGPSVFGIFSDENSQISAFNVLKNHGINAFLCKTV